LALSGHLRLAPQCPLLGVKRTLPQSCSPKTKRGGSRRVSRSCQAFFKMLSLRPQPGEEFRHANDDKNHFGGLLNWCSGNWHTHTCQRSILSTARLQPPSPTGGRRRRRLPLRPSSDMGWMPPGVDGSGPPIVTIRYLGRVLRTLQRSGRWLLEWILEWMPTRLHSTRGKADKAKRRLLSRRRTWGLR
jgi:hypothetical protein